MLNKCNFQGILVVRLAGLLTRSPLMLLDSFFSFSFAIFSIIMLIPVMTCFVSFRVSKDLLLGLDEDLSFFFSSYCFRSFAYSARRARAASLIFLSASFSCSFLASCCFIISCLFAISSLASSEVATSPYIHGWASMLAIQRRSSCS